MSIALGIPCSNGLVMGVDLQYSTGIVKTSGRKLFPLMRFYGTEYSVLIAGAGIPDTAKKAVEMIDSSLPVTFTFTEFVQHAETSLAALLAQYIDPAPAADQEALRCDLLFGVRIGQESRLFRSNRSMLVEEHSAVCVGMGLYLGNYLLDLLLPSTRPTAGVAEQVAAYVISATKEYIESVGKGTDIHVLRDDGQHYGIHKAERRVIDEYFEFFFDSLRAVIDSCDTERVSDQDTEIYLDAMRKSVARLRKAQKTRNTSRRNRAMFTESFTRAKSNLQSTKTDSPIPTPLPESPGGSSES